MKKRIPALLTMIALLCSMMIFAASADSVISIKTIAQLDAVRNNLTASYRLDADIIYAGSGFTPIAAGNLENPGAESEEFTGTFDGNGHYIRGLVITVDCSNEETMPFAGLFGTSSGTIRDLELQDLLLDFTTDLTQMDVVMQEAYIGGIAARNKGTISGCTVTGSIRATTIGSSKLDVGGIAGGNFRTITNCLNRADISCASNSNAWIAAGGIVGYQGYNNLTTNGTVTSSVNFGSVSATTTHATQTNLYTAGIVAYNYGPITDSYYVDTAQGVNNKGTKYTKNNTLTAFSASDDGNAAVFPALDFVSVWHITNGKLSLRGDDILHMFDLTIAPPSLSQTDTDDPLYTLYFRVTVSGTDLFNTDTGDIKVFSYGLLYSTNEEALTTYIENLKNGVSVDEPRVVRYTYEQSEMGLTRIYRKFGYRFTRIQPGKTRCAAAYICFEHNGVVYEEYSALSSVTAE